MTIGLQEIDIGEGYIFEKENIRTLLEIEQSKWTGNTCRIFTAN